MIARADNNDLVRKPRAAKAGWRSLADDRMLLALLMFSLATFVGVTFRTTGLCLLVWAIALAKGLFIARHSITKIDSTIRSVYMSPWIAFFGAALIIPATIWLRRVTITSRSINALELAVDFVAHSALAVGLWVWSRNPRRGHVSQMVAMTLALFMSVASGGVSGMITGQTAIGLVTVLGFIATSQIVFSPSSIRSSLRLGTLIYTSTAILAMLMVTSAMTQLTTRSLSEIQAFISSGLKDQLEAGATEILGSGTRYVTGQRLGNVRRVIESNPQEVVLKGYSEQVPGYLRGNIFDHYQAGSWDARAAYSNSSGSGSAEGGRDEGGRDEGGRGEGGRDEGGRDEGGRGEGGLGEGGLGEVILRPIAQASVPLTQPERGDRFRYPMIDSDSASDPQISSPPIVGTVELLSDPTRGNKSFLPEATVWVELVGQSVVVSNDRTLVRGVDFDEPYVAGVAAAPVPQPLTQNDRTILTALPKQMEGIIRKTATEAFGVEALGSKLSGGEVLGDDASDDDGFDGNQSSPDVLFASEKVAKLATFFQNKFTYSLERQSGPRWIDPLWYFLERRHPAHCEYFAAAGMFLLRSQGIPARYVTGYVMDEPSEDANSYVARNSDAHAWVEYYDQSDSRWKVAEMTPGKTYKPFGQGADEITSTADAMLDEKTQTGAGSRFYEQLRQLLGLLPMSDALVSGFRYAQVPLLVGLSWVLYRRIRKPGGNSSEHTRRLEALDRKARRWGMIREDSETLHQFAIRVETTTPLNANKNIEWQQLGRSLADDYRHHARSLYRAV
jgi:hypothetical protein